MKAKEQQADKKKQDYKKQVEAELVDW